MIPRRRELRANRIEHILGHPLSARCSDTDGTHVVDVSTGETSLVVPDVGVHDWFGNDRLIVEP